MPVGLCFRFAILVPLSIRSCKLFYSKGVGHLLIAILLLAAALILTILYLNFWLRENRISFLQWLGLVLATVTVAATLARAIFWVFMGGE